MGEKQKLFVQQADLLLEVLNQQRHDWLNHFQVLLGYLKLGRNEAGVEYLKRVTEETHRESMIARINCPKLSVFFLTFNALNDHLRLEVEICNQLDMSRLELEQEQIFQQVTAYVLLIEKHLQHVPMEQANLLISFMADEQMIQIKYDFAGCLHESAGPELEKLVERSTHSGATVSEWLHTDDEWVMELRFPCRR